MASPEVDALTAQLLKKASALQSPDEIELDKFWAREHACYLRCCAEYGLRYREYLPGREYTYRLVANLILRSCGRTPATVLELGCGSGLGCILLAARGARAAGIDKSMAGLNYARQLASEYAAEVALVRGTWAHLPFPEASFDVVFSLGTLEHLSQQAQLVLWREAARVSQRLLVLLVPNENSPIFQTMEEREFAEMPAELVYPEEYRRSRVDLAGTASKLGLAVVEHSALHLAPPIRMPAKHLDRGSYAFFRDLVGRAEAAWNGDAVAAWLAAESSTIAKERSARAWFEYVVCRK